MEGVVSKCFGHPLSSQLGPMRTHLYIKHLHVVWLAIKDSLTHRPSSQGWAPESPLGSSLFCPCILYGVRVVITFLPSMHFLAIYVHVFPCETTLRFIHIC